MAGVIFLLGVGRVVVGPLKPLPAFRTAEQAVPALAIESVTTMQARNASGDLFADQNSE
jgi:hypothetical protein